MEALPVFGWILPIPLQDSQQFVCVKAAHPSSLFVCPHLNTFGHPHMHAHTHTSRVRSDHLFAISDLVQQKGTATSRHTDTPRNLWAQTLFDKHPTAYKLSPQWLFVSSHTTNNLSPQWSTYLCALTVKWLGLQLVGVICCRLTYTSHCTVSGHRVRHLVAPYNFYQRSWRLNSWKQKNSISCFLSDFPIFLAEQFKHLHTYIYIVL